MKKELFPEEFIQASVENYTFKINRPTNRIYIVLLSCLLIFLVILPLVSVDVIESVSGRITSMGKKYSIQAPVTARVVFSSLEENLNVKKGDTLVRFDDRVIISEVDRIGTRKSQLDQYIQDLALLSDQTSASRLIRSDRYQLEYVEFIGQTEKSNSLLGSTQKRFDIQKALYEKGIISQKEFDEIQTELDQAVMDSRLYQDGKKTEWQQQIINFKEESRQLNIQLSQLKDQLVNYSILSSTSGNLQNITPLQIGQYLHAGSELGEISPDDELVASCFVSPSDIGMLQLGQEGYFRIDAFNFNEWGGLKGQIIEISDDVYFSEDGQAYFIVKSKLHEQTLSLANGVVGKVKKGMTFQSNFYLTERTLFQLLYDKADNLVNPQVRTNQLSAK
ncbi:HlyD family secretion protein [Reichenbachiella agarivorans]|uniref:HlyD family secretion protein n=1 Tax=Reichenbachiella agarivorans TaxID=2979464 RepID=A0ABY6CNC9_9BACT|nr:HlyD family secretion protein [Reichenbachiella agarivorans]UXP32027.1 HlyD family secretion protein [Reichenbachiella agarivorans]